MKIKIPTLEQLREYVTGKRTQKAVCGNEHTCLIAAWVLKNNPAVDDVEVWPGVVDSNRRYDPAELYTVSDGRGREQELPKELAQFINAFDQIGIDKGLQMGYVPTKEEVLAVLDNLIAENI